MKHALTRMMKPAAAVILTILLASPLARAQYRPGEYPVGDQPGYVSDQERPDSAFQTQPVFFRTTEAPGTIIIHTSERYLYLVQGNNSAIRYGIGVGREGFQWAGLQRISRKAEWPDWTPPPEMIARQPY